MDGDSPEIPVQPIPFEHGLVRFAQSLVRGQVRIVAIGSSSTAGEPGIDPYPVRLEKFLNDAYPKAGIIVANKGVIGEEAPAELLRFDRDVISERPDLVIWQVGTNAVWQSPNNNPPPPSFIQTTRAIQDGLVKLRDDAPQADVILMDLQYLPAVLTPAKHDKAVAMVEMISEIARDAGVNVFRRFAFMEGLLQIERFPLDRMTSPTDEERRLHQSEWSTHRVAWAMRIAIVDGVKKAGASPPPTAPA